jgi:hypothetical protein
MISRFDLAVIAAFVAFAAMWTERAQRVVIDAPTTAEQASPAVTAACPDNDSVPYSPGCLEFMGDYVFDTNWLMNAAHRAPGTGTTRPTSLASLSGSCPDSDDVPYSASCIAFMAGSSAARVR